jgi:SAM-dependent methyltransferase
LKELRCAICQTNSKSKLLYRQNLNFQEINQATFSARRAPDRRHYNIVKCQSCGLVYSTPVLETAEIEKLYNASDFTYESVTADLKNTYGLYLKMADKFVNTKEKLLEIGCGNGFFLEKAKELGYLEVHGVEPSVEATRRAVPGIALNILNCVFGPGLYPKSQFDIVCFFQTLDHIVDPNKFLEYCRSYLKGGGIILCITHNISSFTAKILREKCPMIDVEHIYLFNKVTLKKIFEQNGFDVLDIFDVANIYPFWYYLKMFPFPKSIKERLVGNMTKTGFGNIRLRLKAGNIGIIARKYSE